MGRSLQKLIKHTTLEKYKAVLDGASNNLNALEFKDLVTIYDVALVIQKMEMVMRVMI